jgi:hypothetical protein
MQAVNSQPPALEEWYTLLMKRGMECNIFVGRSPKFFTDMRISEIMKFTSV